MQTNALRTCTACGKTISAAQWLPHLTNVCLGAFAEELGEDLEDHQILLRSKKQKREPSVVPSSAVSPSSPVSASATSPSASGSGSDVLTFDQCVGCLSTPCAYGRSAQNKDRCLIVTGDQGHESHRFLVCHAHHFLETTEKSSIKERLSFLEHSEQLTRIRDRCSLPGCTNESVFRLGHPVGRLRGTTSLNPSFTKLAYCCTDHLMEGMSQHTSQWRNAVPTPAAAPALMGASSLQTKQ